MEMMFRQLKADEIEVRIGSIGEKGVSLLLFKNARVDMTILDETVGATNWQRDHKEVKGNLYCGIGIYDNIRKDYVWKWDCGTESYTEKEKGEASDSFKRAGFNWGIGRELYTAPFTFIPGVTEKKGDKFYLTKEGKAKIGGCYVSEILYDETDTARKISKVVICDRSGNAIFKWDAKQNYVKAEKKTPNISNNKKIEKGGVDFLKNLIMETGTDLKAIADYYKVKSLEEMTVSQFEDAVQKLMNKKEKENV